MKMSSLRVRVLLSAIARDYEQELAISILNELEVPDAKQSVF